MAVKSTTSFFFVLCVISVQFYDTRIESSVRMKSRGFSLLLKRNYLRHRTDDVGVLVSEDIILLCT